MSDVIANNEPHRMPGCLLTGRGVVALIFLSWAPVLLGQDMLLPDRPSFFDDPDCPRSFETGGLDKILELTPSYWQPVWEEPSLSSPEPLADSIEPDSQIHYSLDLENVAPDAVIDGLGRRRSRVTGFASQFGNDLWADHRNFYSSGNVRLLLGAFAIGAVTANTPFDESLRDILHENLVYTPSDEYAEYLHEHRYLGDGYILLPAYLAIAVVGKGLINEPHARVVGEWGERNIRGMLVGTPVLLLSQRLTGGSRPNETGHASDWRPFEDDNGVSGHAFMGAVPFLTAGHMSRNKWAKAGFYAASAMPGLSRITDDRHYPSQVFLGWTLAWVATSSVAKTERDSSRIEFAPMTVGGTPGFGVTLRR